LVGWLFMLKEHDYLYQEMGDGCTINA